jgi:hypothetical protein
MDYVSDVSLTIQPSVQAMEKKHGKLNKKIEYCITFSGLASCHQIIILC